MPIYDFLALILENELILSVKDGSTESKDEFRQIVSAAKIALKMGYIKGLEIKIEYESGQDLPECIRISEVTSLAKARLAAHQTRAN